MLAASQQSRFQRPVSKPETGSAQASLRDGTVGDAARSRFGEELGARALAPAPLRLTLCERSHSHAPPILLEHRHWGFQGPGLEEQAAAGTLHFEPGGVTFFRPDQAQSLPPVRAAIVQMQIQMQIMRTTPALCGQRGPGSSLWTPSLGGCGGPDRPGANKTTPDTATRSCALRCTSRSIGITSCGARPSWCCPNWGTRDGELGHLPVCLIVAAIPLSPGGSVRCGCIPIG